MTGFEALTISGETLEQFLRSLASVIQALPPEMKGRLLEMRRDYFAAYGFEGTRMRLNHRTVSQIFAEYKPTNAKPIASGEVDGVRYALYEAPRPNTTDSAGGADQQS